MLRRVAFGPPSHRISIAAGAFLVAACGGAPATPVGVSTASPGPSASPGHVVVKAPGAAPATPFRSDVPMATMPPPFQFGSKRAEKKVVAGAAACVAPPAGPATDPAAEVARIGRACAAATHMHAVAAPIQGKGGQGQPAQAFKFKAEAGRCYRIVAATAPTVKNVELLVVDSDGAVADEARSDEPRVAAAADGAICFKSGDDAQAVVSVGAGDGAFALQIWSD